MGNFYIVNDLLEDIRLDVSKSIRVIWFAVRTLWHMPILGFHILDEASIAQENRAVLAFFRVHWHLQTDQAPHDVWQLLVVDFIICASCRASEKNSLVFFLLLHFFRAWSTTFFLLLYQVISNFSWSLIWVCRQLIVGSWDSFYANNRLFNLEHLPINSWLGNEEVKLIWSS
mgnify:CR=1 FL=1